MQLGDAVTGDDELKLRSLGDARLGAEGQHCWDAGRLESCDAGLLKVATPGARLFKSPGTVELRNFERWET